MNLHSRHRLRNGLAIVCSLAITLTFTPVYAEDDIADLQGQAGNLENELSNINQELLSISDEISNYEAQIDTANNEILRIQDSLAISQENENRQYEDMKARIQYMYENGNATLLEMLFSAENISDFLNKADFIQSVSDYDRDMLSRLRELQNGINKQYEELETQQSSLTALHEELLLKQEELNTRAAETSTDLSALNALIAQRRAELANQQTSPSNPSNPSGGSGGSSTPPPSGNGDYVYPSGDGVLTPEKGVVYFNGHRETYYSQKVLPGGGLNIPGRHVAPDGTIRDKDNYICVASVDYPWGTVVQTSLGPGKVYDSGCASGTIDIYTDW